MTQAFQIAPGVPGNKLISAVWAGGRESHNSDTPLTVGGFAFDPTDYDIEGTTKVVKFRVTAANGDVALTNHVQLYNVTDNEVVASSALTFTTTDLDKKDATLVLGSGAGELKLAETLYEVRIYLGAVPGGPTETIEIYSAEMIVENTIA